MLFTSRNKSLYVHTASSIANTYYKTFQLRFIIVLSIGCGVYREIVIALAALESTKAINPLMPTVVI